jgi:hypothetical protein
MMSNEDTIGTPDSSMVASCRVKYATSGAVTFWRDSSSADFGFTLARSTPRLRSWSRTKASSALLIWPLRRLPERSTPDQLKVRTRSAVAVRVAIGDVTPW